MLCCICLDHTKKSFLRCPQSQKHTSTVCATCAVHLFAPNITSLPRCPLCRIALPFDDYSAPNMTRVEITFSLYNHGMKIWRSWRQWARLHMVNVANKTEANGLALEKLNELCKMLPASRRAFAAMVEYLDENEKLDLAEFVVGTRVNAAGMKLHPRRRLTPMTRYQMSLHEFVVDTMYLFLDPSGPCLLKHRVDGTETCLQEQWRDRMDQRWAEAAAHVPDAPLWIKHTQLCQKQRGMNDQLALLFAIHPSGGGFAQRTVNSYADLCSTGFQIAASYQEGIIPLPSTQWFFGVGDERGRDLLLHHPLNTKISSQGMQMAINKFACNRAHNNDIEARMLCVVDVELAHIPVVTPRFSLASTNLEDEDKWWTMPVYACRYDRFVLKWNPCERAPEPMGYRYHNEKETWICINSEFSFNHVHVAAVALVRKMRIYKQKPEQCPCLSKVASELEIEVCSAERIGITRSILKSWELTI